MRELKWTPLIETGLQTVDDEHRSLFALYNQVAAHEGSVDQDELLKQLVAYASVHFASEENLMRSEGYPYNETLFHINEHREFSRRVAQLARKPVYQLLDFVHEWLLRHILVSDLRIGVFIRKSSLEQKGPGTQR